jgi:hypothetical protein
LAGDEVAACGVDSGGGKFDGVDRKTKPTPGRRRRRTEEMRPRTAFLPYAPELGRPNLSHRGLSPPGKEIRGRGDQI